MKMPSERLEKELGDTGSIVEGQVGVAATAHRTLVVGDTDGKEPSEPLHIVTQDGQGYGSQRRCCEHCGRMCWSGMKGSASRWTDDWRQWNDATDKCTLDRS